VTPPARIACLVVVVAGIATAPLERASSRVLLGVWLAVVLLVTRPAPRWLLTRGGPALLGVAALLVPFALTAAPERVALLAARALGAASAALSIGSTVALHEVGPALGRLGFPRALAGTVRALLWQVGHVGMEGRRLLLARALRGERGFGPEVLAQLLVRTTARAERVDLAMRLRGADLSTSAERARFGAVGLAALLISAAASVALHAERLRP
jgi:energy-coupling factor transporter transmembrane protein EcfT